MALPPSFRASRSFAAPARALLSKSEEKERLLAVYLSSFYMTTHETSLVVLSGTARVLIVFVELNLEILLNFDFCQSVLKVKGLKLYRLQRTLATSCAILVVYHPNAVVVEGAVSIRA